MPVNRNSYALLHAKKNYIFDSLLAPPLAGPTRIDDMLPPPPPHRIDCYAAGLIKFPLSSCEPISAKSVYGRKVLRRA